MSIDSLVNCYLERFILLAQSGFLADLPDLEPMFSTLCSCLSPVSRAVQQLGEERDQVLRLNGLGLGLGLQVLDVVHDQMRPDRTRPGIGGDDVMGSGDGFSCFLFQ